MTPRKTFPARIFREWDMSVFIFSAKPQNCWSAMLVPYTQSSSEDKSTAAGQQSQRLSFQRQNELGQAEQRWHGTTQTHEKVERHRHQALRDTDNQTTQHITQAGAIRIGTCSLTHASGDTSCLHFRI